jgi:hypothetical protein
MYSNWNKDTSTLVQTFQIPRYYWLLIFSLLASLVYLFGNIIAKQSSKTVNIVSIIVLIIIILHLMDFLFGFIFCHDWGCSHQRLMMDGYELLDELD